MDLDPQLAALRPLGGFFALSTAPPTGGPGEPARPLPTLAQAYAAAPTGADGDPPADLPADPPADPLAFRIGKVARALRAPEPRIAASVAQQGLAARLWSVALGCAVLYVRPPELAPGLLRWDPDGSAPDDLWLTEVHASRPADAETLAATVLHGHLEPLAAALRARHRLAPGLLRGNAASALAGAARQLDAWARAHGRPDAAARTRALTAELLAHPLLAGTGTLTGTAFRRRSCCLYHRVPGGGVCGDCCFVRPPRSSPRGPSG
ncbi:ferric iron reductase [Streptomyces phaeoluteigriseus]|uniref:Ferric iron reductase n=1 Tax=Streptomyces phaeoluteigriseus TaxID=114686 RepID=A0A1V6MYA5_9ACTN|nr:(2Fe-2S)-binding protein [Streptomyces phaeoluteigriseus]OQD57411.1 ferric iron reductase [Streptomyces phaeoluteigriseus]